MFKDELIIIRHARSTNNVRQTSDPDCSLTEFGKKQASRLGKFMLKHMDLSAHCFYTSPLLRCLQTAYNIQLGMGDDGEGNRFAVMSSLREYINHNCREMTLKSHYRDFPKMDWWDSPRNQDTVFKDEFNEEFINRMYEVYSKLPQRSVVVTHGLPALLLLEIATNNVNSVPIWDHSLDNCSVSFVKNGRAIWRGRNLYNEMEDDPFDVTRQFDKFDLLIPKV